MILGFVGAAYFSILLVIVYYFGWYGLGEGETINPLDEQILSALRSGRKGKSKFAEALIDVSFPISPVDVRVEVPLNRTLSAILKCAIFKCLQDSVF